ncbi:MAG: glycosyltransferase family 4 protein [Kiritimatiellae bacterium]|nr:glycosyltransferase family 4 protein [Kiritimatiellia bacterium]
MKIGIMARGLSVEIGGPTTYLERIIPLLPQADPQNEYIIFHNSERHRGTFAGYREVFHGSRSAFLWENAWFPRAVRREKPDVIFCPKNLVPWFIPRRIRTVITVHDLLYFPIAGVYISEYLPADVLYMRLFFRRSVRRADTIVAVSENTRRDLIRLFQAPPDKIRAIPHGVEMPRPEQVSKSRTEEVRRKYGLDKPYIFYSGSLSPRKNMARVVEAFAGIADRVPHDLVVTAGKSWKDEAVFEAAAKYGLPSRFKRLGTVPGDDLPALYAAADLFVYVSLYEGFGMPILEAMACGCPVLASNTSAMPEAAGEAAVLVDPRNTAAIGDAMLKILTDPGLAGNLREKGTRRAQECTWARTAQGLVEAFGAAAPTDAGTSKEV